MLSTIDLLSIGCVHILRQQLAEKPILSVYIVTNRFDLLRTDE